MIKFNEGAEGKIYFEKFLGINLAIKIRTAKHYRINKLDERIRQYRTKREAKIISVLENKINTPKLIGFGRYTIVTEKLNGKLLKDIKNKKKYMKSLGAELRLMHANKVAHGDFTPANIMIDENTVYVIDFGLSEITEDIEELALDLLLMKRSLTKEEYRILSSSYAKNNAKFSKIINKLNEIELRGRYNLRTLA